MRCGQGSCRRWTGTAWLGDTENREAVPAFLAARGVAGATATDRPVALSRLQYYRARDLPAVLNLQISGR